GPEPLRNAAQPGTLAAGRRNPPGVPPDPADQPARQPAGSRPVRRTAGTPVERSAWLQSAVSRTGLAAAVRPSTSARGLGATRAAQGGATGCSGEGTARRQPDSAVPGTGRALAPAGMDRARLSPAGERPAQTGQSSAYCSR